MTKHSSQNRRPFGYTEQGKFKRPRPRNSDRGPLKYFVFWKPYDVLSQFKPASGSKADTLASYIPHSDIYPAGRLDRDSEGLMILSNDGLFQHKLCEPRFEHWRTYLVQVERVPDDRVLETLRRGLEIKGQLTSLARVERLSCDPVLPERIPPIRYRKSVETAWIKLSLTEGRNRQVRRMTAAVGHPTLRLVRAEIHLNDQVTINLDGLKPGALRSFNDRELGAVDTLKKRQASSTKI